MHFDNSSPHLSTVTIYYGLHSPTQLFMYIPFTDDLPSEPFHQLFKNLYYYMTSLFGCESTKIQCYIVAINNVIVIHMYNY